MHSPSNAGRKRTQWVPPTELPRIPQNSSTPFDQIPKKQLTTIDSEPPFEYYNNYPKRISKTSNAVSSINEDQYGFDIEEPLRYLDTESEANPKSENLTAIEEVETKGEDLQPRESALESVPGQVEEAEQQIQAQVAAEEEEKLSLIDEPSLSISKIGDFISEEVKDFIQESHAIETDIKRLGTALKQANTHQQHQSMLNQNSEILSVSNDMRNYSAFNPGQARSTESSFVHRALSSKSIPRDETAAKLPPRPEESRNRPLQKGLKKVIAYNHASAIHPMKKIALTAFSDPSLSARSKDFIGDDDDQADNEGEPQPSFINQEFTHQSTRQIVSHTPTLPNREINFSPTMDPMSLGSERQVETEEDESQDLIDDTRQHYEQEESNVGGADLYDELLNEMEEMVANITDLARVQGIYIQSPDTQSPVNDLNEIVTQLVGECKMRMDKMANLEEQNNKMKEVMMGLNETLTEVNREAVHLRKKYKKLKQENKAANFPNSIFQHDPLNAGPSTVSTDNRTIAREDNFKVSSRSHFDPKKDKRCESSMSDAHRYIRELEQRLKDSEVRFYQQKEAEKSIREKFSQQMSDITTKDKQILKLQSQIQSLNQRIDLSKATQMFKRPMSPLAGKTKKELEEVQAQYNSTKQVLDKTMKELEFNHKQNVQLKQQRNNYRMQVDQHKAIFRKMAQLFGNQNLEAKQILGSVQNASALLKEHQLFFRKLGTIVIPKEENAPSKFRALQNQVLEKIREAMFSQKQTASNNNNDYGYIQKRAESPFQTTLHATTLQSLSSTPMRSYSKGVPSPFRYQDFKDRNRCVDSEYERNKEFRDYKYHGGDFTYPRTSPYKPKFY